MEKREAISLFKALSDETRLNIILSILNKELSASEIVKIAGKSQPNVSIALRILKDSGLIEQKKQGRFIFYRLRDKEKILGIFKIMGFSAKSAKGTGK